MDNIPEQGKPELQEPQKLLTRSFALACISYGLYQAAHSMGYTVLPLLLDSMYASGTLIGLLTTLNVIAGMLFRPMLGNLSDKHSKRILCLLGMASVLLCYLGMAAAAAVSSIILLLFFRTVHGIGAAAASTSAHAIVADISPREKLVDAFGYFGIISAILGGIAPDIALKLVTDGNYRRGIIAISAVVAASVISMTLISYEKEEWFSIRQREERKNPTSVRGISRYIEVSAVPTTIVIFLVYFSVSSSNSFLVLYAGECGFDDIGLYFIIASIGAVLFRFLVGPIRNRFSDRMVLLAGLVMLIINYSVITRMKSLALLILSGLLNGIGTGIYSAILNSSTLNKATPERFGIASSTMLLGIDLGYMAGSVVWGIISDALGYKAVFTSATAILVISAASSLAITRTKQKT